MYNTRKLATYDPIAKPLSPQNKSVYNGYFLVRADSDINSIEDLKGKTLLFGPKANAAKFLAPYATLKKAGIDIDEDLKEYSFGGACPDIAMSVYLGDYDAGVTCGLYMAQMVYKKFNLETDLRVLTTTDDVPYWIFSASDKKDREKVEKVKQALLKPDKKNPETSEVLDIVRWNGFVEVTGNESDKIEELVETYSVPVPFLLLKPVINFVYA